MLQPKREIFKKLQSNERPMRNSSTTDNEREYGKSGIHGYVDPGRTRFHFSWTAVFWLNTVVPILIERNLADHRGEFGIAAACVLLWFVSQLAFERLVNWRPRMLVGGTNLAFFQLFPIVQIGAGVASLAIVDWLFPIKATGGGSAVLSAVPLQSNLQGFLATVLTGGQLLLASILIGIATNVERTDHPKKLAATN